MQERHYPLIRTRLLAPSIFTRCMIRDEISLQFFEPYSMVRRTNTKAMVQS